MSHATAYHLSPATYHLLSTTYYLPPTIYYLPLPPTWIGGVWVADVPHESLHRCPVGLSVGCVQVSQCGWLTREQEQGKEQRARVRVHPTFRMDLGLAWCCIL